jgi:hypothetical protein
VPAQADANPHDIAITEAVSALVLRCATYREWRKPGHANSAEPRRILEEMLRDVDRLRAAIECARAHEEQA